MLAPIFEWVYEWVPGDSRLPSAVNPNLLYVPFLQIVSEIVVVTYVCKIDVSMRSMTLKEYEMRAYPSPLWPVSVEPVVVAAKDELPDEI